MCTMLTIIFVATGRSIFPMLWGPSERERPSVGERWMTALPKLGFVAVLILLGVYTPGPISRLLRDVAQSIGGQRLFPLNPLSWCPPWTGRSWN
jgi:hydrogenase-4 component F